MRHARAQHYEIRPGRLLGLGCSVHTPRGIREEILEEIAKVIVLDVIVFASAADKVKNRGFAFVGCESHCATAMARRKLCGATRSPRTGPSPRART